SFFLCYSIHTMLKRLLGIKREPQIHIYRGFGSKDEVVILARVTETVPYKHPHKKFNPLYNLLTFIRNYLASPLEGVKVHIEFSGITTVVESSKAGMVEAHFQPKEISETIT